MRRDLAQMRLLAIMLLVLMAIGANSPFAFADQGTTGSAVVTVSGPGVEVVMQGNVQPTILSVTMPSNIMFDIGKSVEGENKVLSPAVRIQNNSDVPISVYAAKTQVDLSSLPGTQYVPSVSGGSIYPTTDGAFYVSSSGMYITVGALQILDNEIAIGLSPERTTTDGAVMPGLDQAKWLVERDQSPWEIQWSDQVAYVSENGEQILHVVGMIGKSVPENQSFTVVPTLIAATW